MNRVSDGDRSTLLSSLSCRSNKSYPPQSDEVFPLAPPQHMFLVCSNTCPSAWMCTCATDSNLESGFSEATVILTAFSVRAYVLGPEK